MDSGHYVSVRAKDGGGTRIVEMSGDSKKSDIISYGKKLFFPSGLSPLASSDDLLFQLGNYKQEHVEATACFLDGTIHPFTLSNYSKSNKLPKKRLYIMTKKIEESDSDSDSEVNVVTFAFTTANVASMKKNLINFKKIQYFTGQDIIVMPVYPSIYKYVTTRVCCTLGHILGCVTH